MESRSERGAISPMNQTREGTFFCFAYGSNMLTEWLHTRCPSARPLGNAIARGFSLSFSKRSRDGSAKATLVKAEESEQAACGVLFQIPHSEQTALDKAEGKGKGYDRDDAFIVVRLVDGKEMTSSTYRASPRRCDEDLVPYEWYHALIMAGALQHGLPEGYVAELRQTIVRPDPEPQRDSRQEALRVLRCAGFHQVLE
jgi:gamma-glutamylcyclotransferase